MITQYTDELRMAVANAFLTLQGHDSLTSIYLGKGLSAHMHPKGDIRVRYRNGHDVMEIVRYANIAEMASVPNPRNESSGQ